MIQALEIRLETQDGTRLHPAMGSLLHGFLMENLDGGYCEVLHRQALRPYSQYLYFDKERQAFFWRITTLTREAKEQILEAAMNLPDTILIRRKDLQLKVADRTLLPATSYELLAERYFTLPLPGNIVRLAFITPCGFKSNGEYVIFPQPHLVFASLVNRWNAFSPKERLDGPDIAQDLAREVYVAGYHMSLKPFSVDGARIPAFIGSYALGMKSNLMSNRIIAMLCDFASYSGIGIKTALGMGAVTCSFMAKGGKALPKPSSQ